MSNSVKISKPTWAKVQESMRRADYSVAAAAQTASTDKCIAYVYNGDMSQTTIPDFGIIGFHSYSTIIHPYNNLAQFKKNPILYGLLTGTDQKDKNLWGIALEPIAYGKIGKVLISGLSICRIIYNGSNDLYATCQIDSDRQLRLISTSNPTHCQILSWRFDDPEGYQWAIVRMGNAGGGGIRHAYLVSPLQLPATNTLKCRLDNATTGQLVNVKFHVFNGSLSADPGWSLLDNILPPIDTAVPIPVYQSSGVYYTLWWFTGVTSCVT